MNLMKVKKKNAKTVETVERERERERERRLLNNQISYFSKKGGIMSVRRNFMTLLVVLIMLLVLSFCIGKVQAFSLIEPEGEDYLRWDTSKLGSIDVAMFLALFGPSDTSDEGIVTKDTKVYKADNTEAKDTDLIGTGMYFKVDNQTVKFVIKGDINGDGKVTPTDLSLFKQMYVKSIDLEYCYKKAGDMNNDKEITAVDNSQLKMMLVGLPLPEEEADPSLPKLDGEVKIIASTTTSAQEVEVRVEFPSGENIDGYKKMISLDGGETFIEYTGPITLKENVFVIAGYYDENNNELGEEGLLISNIDTIAPEDYSFTYEVSTSTITLTAETTDKIKDYTGTLTENEYSGVQKYLYKIDDGEWQESNVFENLKANTEYRVYVKAVDYAGNEKEATNNGIIVKTDPMLDPTVEGSRILISYDITKPTAANVTVTFTLEDETLLEKYDIQYQVNEITGKWTTGTKYVAIGNCTIYARLVDKSGQVSENYVTGQVTNIDKLEPLRFTPTIEYKNESNKTIISVAHAEDAPADETNMCSGIANIYYYYWIYKDGSWGTGPTMPVETNTYEIYGNLLDQSGEENPIIGIVVDILDNAGNKRRSEVKYLTDVEIPDDELGYDFNEGPGNVTIQGAEKSYDNPVIPVGFKAVETEGASWGPYLPSGWNEGLVIEDKKGNQFVWVPVPCEEGTSGVDAIDAVILNTREHIDNEYNLKDYFDEIPAGISNDEVKTETGKYGYEYRTEIIEQVEEYQGFYIARYEAGRKDGLLAAQEGLETVNMVTYEQAKSFAEGMYQNPYVISGLPTGVHWDLVSEWIEKEYGRENEDYIGKGNLSWFEFTFTGRYAEGPDYGSTGTRGEYKYGENVTKHREEEMLLTTGIVEDFRMKNIYDLLGNVWEYTSERVTLNVGITGHDARGADYFWSNNPVDEDPQLVWRTDYRCNVPDGDARNEGGFRVILFLSEGEGKVEGEYNSTINGGRADYNNPIIPAGYKPVNTGEAKWGDGTMPAQDWNKGLVIEDKNGNQYVWVPVDGTNVKYETWLDVYLTHEEVGASEIPAAWSKLGGTEESSVKEFKGFYIARYETSLDGKENASTKENQTVKTVISYNEAVELVNKYENGKTSVAGIVTGRQWDTALRWIANERGEETVTTNSSSIGNYNSTIGKTGRKSVKNIYDIAGNAWELTSETYGGKIVYRGGSSYETGEDAPVGYRDAYERAYKDESTTFRMVLYVQNDGYTVKDVAVPDDTPGVATNGTVINFTSTPGGWTNGTVTVNISSKIAGRIIYSFTPKATGVQGEWKEGSTVTVTERGTILAKIVDENGNSKSAAVGYVVSNIDKEAPAAFTPSVTVETNRLRINCGTTDALSGVSYYRYFIDNGYEIREATTTCSNLITNTIGIGQHTFYVEAYDNAGNVRRSASVPVNITAADLLSVLKPGDWVESTATYVSLNQYGEWVATPFATDLDGRTYKTRYSGVNKYGTHMFITKDIYVDYTNGAWTYWFYIGKTSRYDLTWAFFSEDRSAPLVTGGSGTEADPYTVNQPWWIGKRSAHDSGH